MKRGVRDHVKHSNRMRKDTRDNKKMLRGVRGGMKEREGVRMASKRT